MKSDRHFSMPAPALCPARSCASLRSIRPLRTSRLAASFFAHVAEGTALPQGARSPFLWHLDRRRRAKRRDADERTAAVASQSLAAAPVKATWYRRAHDRCRVATSSGGAAPSARLFTGVARRRDVGEHIGALAQMCLACRSLLTSRMFLFLPVTHEESQGRL